MSLGPETLKSFNKARIDALCTRIDAHITETEFMPSEKKLIFNLILKASDIPTDGELTELTRLHLKVGWLTSHFKLENGFMDTGNKVLNIELRPYRISSHID